MSDIIADLLDRHMGKGEQVLPRARSRFEPAAGAIFLPQDAEENSHSITSGVTIPPNDPSVDIPAVNTVDDYNPVKDPVHHQHQPGPVIGSVEMKTKTMEPESQPVPRAIPREPLEVDIDKKKVFSDEPAIAPSPVPGPVRQGENVSRELPAVYKYTMINESRVENNIENPSDGKVQNTSQRLLPPAEPEHTILPGKSHDNPIHSVTVKTQEGHHAQQSDQQRRAAPESSLLPGLPVDITEPGPLFVEPQLVTTTLKNADSGAGGLLEAPAWLPGRQTELHKGLLLEDSKAGEPVVNVTIGRIEVRAAPPPASGQPRRKKKPSGVMSLDKYLGLRIGEQGGNP